MPTTCRNLLLNCFWENTLSYAHDVCLEELQTLELVS